MRIRNLHFEKICYNTIICSRTDKNEKPVPRWKSEDYGRIVFIGCVAQGREQYPRQNIVSKVRRQDRARVRYSINDEYKIE